MIIGTHTFEVKNVPNHADVTKEVIVSIDEDDMIYNLTTIESDVTYVVNAIGEKNSVALVRDLYGYYTIIAIYSPNVEDTYSLIIKAEKSLKLALVSAIRQLLGRSIKLSEIEDDIYIFANDIVLNKG